MIYLQFESSKESSLFHLDSPKLLFLVSQTTSTINILFTNCHFCFQKLKEKSIYMFTPRIKVHQLSSSFRFFFSYQLTRKVVSLVLILNLLTATTFAAADGQGLLISAGEMGQDIRYAWKTSNNLAAFFSTDIVGTVVSKVTGKRKQPNIQRLVILPYGENNTLTVSQGETINFTAVGLTNNQPVSGVPVEWGYTVVGRESSPRPFKNGTLAKTPQVCVTATAGNSGVYHANC